MDSWELLKRANDRLREHDAPAADEARIVSEGRDVGETFRRESAAAGGPPVDDRLVRETIVRRVGRPVLAIVRDEAQLVFEEPESQAWKARLAAVGAQITAVAKAVGRIEVKGHELDWLGTGWLVGDDIVVTNRHVAQAFARYGGSDYVFRQSIAGGVMSASIDFLEEIGRPESLDWQVERVLHIEDDNGPDLAFLRLKPAANGNTLAARVALQETAAQVEDFVATIGYPARDGRLPDIALMDQIFGNVYDKKRLAPGQVMTSASGQLTHDCSTLGGNSGSIVMSLGTGQAVGLHFAGRFLVANYAVPSHVVAERLTALSSGTLRRPTFSRPRTREREAASTTTPVASGALDFTIPVRVQISLGNPVFNSAGGGDATTVRRAPAASGGTFLPGMDQESRVEDYVDRDGYQTRFLGNGTLSVPMPDASDHPDLLTFEVDGQEDTVLRYEHFSVVMGRSRKMCLFSAANIDGKNTKKKKRGGWRMDPRVKGQQLDKQHDVYGDAPRFARGHMTRRGDPVWGSDDDAQRGNLDSMHMTNVVPQMQPFNAGIWLALEDYALDNAREDDMRISVFTGPIFRSNDPPRFGVKIPVEFWKVIAFIHDETGRLCATGYKLSQKNFLREEEFVFGAHETTQTSIGWIQEQTGLDFGRLVDADPFADTDEAVAVEAPLTALEQIRFV